MLAEQLKAKDDKIKKIKEDIADEKDAKKRAEYQQTLDKCKSADELYDELVKMLSDELKVETKTVKEKCEADSMYEIIKKEVEKTTCDKINKFLSKNELDGIRCEPTTKRFYPQKTLAANVIGYTNYDGVGTYGLEAYYDDLLSGVDGRIITASDKYGTEIPYKYKQSYDAQDGDSLYLNIDMSNQYYLERALANAVQTNMPSERACGIIMEPKTGRVLAMATNYSYDPNKPSEITDPYAAAQLAMIKESAGEESKEFTDTRLAAWSVQWKNKAISELYFPGSVFKVITGSAALEENAITLDETFYCGTQIEVQGAFEVREHPRAVRQRV
jgi:stage V sporulation protein D (sporulation-specific penicillin-binding protein)